MLKTLKIHIPVDDNLQAALELMLLANVSYTKKFWRSIIPPHKVKYIITGLSDKGIENFKQSFREIFASSKYKDNCSFEIIKPELDFLFQMDKHNARVNHLHGNKYLTGVLCPNCLNSELQFKSH